MKKITSCLIHFCLATLCFGGKLPSSFKKCHKNDNKCLSEAAADAIHQLNKPIKEANLPSLEPLEVPSLTIGAGSGPVGLEQKFKNVKIYGFTKPTTTRFELDLEKKSAHLECDFDEVKLIADYDINGKILLLPVYGSGPAQVILEKVHGIENFTLEEYEKKGKKHLKVVSEVLSLDPSLIKFNFDNLFNGDKALGDNINQVVNENWKEVWGDIKSSYEDAFGQIIMGLFNNLLAKIPIEELLDQ
ncbi:protein takeout-like [Tribolium madens]|uniref:protein takeout-like n=1 Tax=Tribolium madens TaxID=41895 RepID=UPI001CF71D36|nr:protein takeout-like [Tribolium madens]